MTTDNTRTVNELITELLASDTILTTGWNTGICALCNAGAICDEDHTFVREEGFLYAPHFVIGKDVDTLWGFILPPVADFSKDNIKPIDGDAEGFTCTFCQPCFETLDFDISEEKSITLPSHVSTHTPEQTYPTGHAKTWQFKYHSLSRKKYNKKPLY